jgi:hypothetical protein
MEKQTTKKPMMPIGKLLSKSFGIYETLGWKIIGMVILPGLVAAIPLILIIVFYALIRALNPDPSSILTISYIVLGLLGIVATIFFLIVSFLANIGAMLLVRENKPNFKMMEALKMSKKYGWKFLGVVLLTTLFVLLGFVVLIIPGIIIATYLSFVSWVVVNENLGGMAALKRSKELIKGYWWSVFGRQLLVGVVIWIVFAIPALFITAETTSEDVYDLVTQIASWALTPFSLAFAYYMYKDLLKIKGSAKSK